MPMMTLATILKEKNLKVTPQRLAIYQMIYHTDKHPSAESVYNGLKRKYPTMSLATVYKTLASLRDKELVQELNFGDGTFRYDACTDFHPHLICTTCSEVFDLKSDCTHALEALQATAREEEGFQSTYGQFFLYGRCVGCVDDK